MRYAAVQSRGALSQEKRTVKRLYGWAFLVRALVGFLAYALTIYADLPITDRLALGRELSTC